MDYDYAVNDYYGNEQARQEHEEYGKKIGYWNARMADGAIHSVNYDANDYGNLAHVIVRQNSYAAPANSAPAQTHAAPSYSAPSYSAPSYTAPKTHYNYEEKNIYGSKSYTAPKTTYSHSATAPADYIPAAVDYAVKDYNGNEHSSMEHVNPVKNVGRNDDYAAPLYSAPTYSAPSYSAPAYSAPSYVAPKMHYNYGEKNIYTPQTYAAPKSTYTHYASSDSVPSVNYAVNDYNGNEQASKEYMKSGNQVGEWSARMADGGIHSVSYEANEYGNLAHVVVRQSSYSAPVQTHAAPYSAPAYSAPTYVAPKTHFNYEEKNVYVPQTYSAPQPYHVSSPSFSSHYAKNDKNII